MESFLKALQELNELVKVANSKSKMQSMHPELPKMPEIKPIPAPSASAGAISKPTKMPGINPGSKKDPVKVAQQLKSGKAQSQKMPLLKFNSGGQWSLDKSAEANNSGGDEVHIRAHLPPHIAKMSHGHEPGTPGWKKYVHAAFDWHDKVHRAVMKDNPHLKHSFGEDLHPRTIGYTGGRLKSESALKKLHKDHGAHYEVSHHESHEDED